MGGWGLLISLLLLGSLVPASSSNVLAIFQHFGFSHFKVYLPVLESLASQGHNLTVVTYIKNPNPHPNYRELLLTGEQAINVADFNEFVVGRSLKLLLKEYFELHNEGQRSCKKFYESSYVENLLTSHAKQPFDLVITEYFNTDCHLGVPYLMDVPVIAFSSCMLMPWLYDRIALPDTPSYIQSEFIGFPEQLNVLQRLLNFVQMKALKLLYRYHTNRLDNQLIKKYLNVDVDIYEVSKRLTNVIFVNQHYTLSGSRPTTPQLVEVGGLHIDENQLNGTLPVEIENFLTQKEPNKDVILISFGSMLRASSFDRTKLNAILQVLQQKDLKVIWKWESNDVPLESDKILFAKWIPQLRLLCHPKVKYFWGHGGMLSSTEALYCGKPLILTPIYGDQFVNAHAVQNRKIGIVINYNSIDVETLENTLNEIQRPRYAQRAQALSKVFRDRDMKPLDKVIWTIEYLLKHKNMATEVLQNKAAYLNFFVFHSLDSLLIIFLIVLAGCLLIFRVFCWNRTKQRHNPQSMNASDRAKKKR